MQPEFGRNSTITNQSQQVKAVLLFSSTMTAMAATVVAPALPSISRHFSNEPTILIQLILTLPPLTVALFSPLLGYLADRFNRVRLLLISLLAYSLAGFGGFMADQIELLLVSRAFLGLAVAGILCITTTLIGSYLEPDERAGFLGIQGSFMALGGVLFMLLGGALADWDWRGPFLVYLTGILLLPYAWLILREPPRKQSSRVEQADAPADVDYLRTGLAYIIGMTSMVLFYVFPTQLPFLLSQQTAASATATGLAISATALTSSLIAYCFGLLKRLFSVAILYMAAFTMAGCGLLIIGLTSSYLMTLVGAAVSGVGFGIFMPNTTTWLMRITPERARGRIFGGFTSTFFLGQFLSPIVVAPLTWWLPSLRDIFTVTALLCFVMAILIVLLGQTVVSDGNRV